MSKVYQIDTCILDSMYQNYISEQLLKALPNKHWVDFCVRAGVLTAHLAGTIWKGKNTPGAEVFNMKWVASTKPLTCLHYLLELFDLLVKKAENKLGVLSKAWKVAVFVNWVRFLVQGKYPFLAQRLGQLRMVDFT